MRAVHVSAICFVIDNCTVPSVAREKIIQIQEMCRNFIELVDEEVLKFSFKKNVIIPFL